MRTPIPAQIALIMWPLSTHFLIETIKSHALISVHLIEENIPYH